MGKATLASRSMSLSRTPHSLVGALAFTCPVLDLETKVKRRFAKVSIVSYDNCVGVQISCLLTVGSTPV